VFKISVADIGPSNSAKSRVREQAAQQYRRAELAAGRTGIYARYLTFMERWW
jgi:hypothetical protein